MVSSFAYRHRNEAKTRLHMMFTAIQTVSITMRPWSQSLTAKCVVRRDSCEQHRRKRSKVPACESPVAMMFFAHTGGNIRCKRQSCEVVERSFLKRLQQKCVSFGDAGVMLTFPLNFCFHSCWCNCIILSRMLHFAPHTLLFYFRHGGQISAMKNIQDVLERIYAGLA